MASILHVYFTRICTVTINLFYIIYNFHPLLNQQSQPWQGFAVCQG